MRILLVNNSTVHFEELSKALEGHEVEVQEYKPGIWFHDVGKDVVILSGGGGEGKELHDYHKPNELWYADEMKFIRSTDKPVLGICMGFEIITAAYGAKITKMPKGIEEFKKVKITLKGRKKFKKSRLHQFEGHDWRVQTVPWRQFDVLGKSKTGVEIIKHKKRSILATQFHPEVLGGTLEVNQLLQAL
jgi:GMP synthase-like glutamine amidotransferase